jgi:hypothetical protein
MQRRTKSALIREALNRLLDEPLSEEEKLARCRAERLEEQWRGDLRDSEPPAR